MKHGLYAFTALTLLFAVLVSLAAYAQSPEEVRIEVEKAAAMASKTVVSVEEAIRVFRELAVCDPQVKPAAVSAIEALRGGFTPSLYIYYKILLTPQGLRNCTASLVYRLLLLAASTRVGPVLAPSNVPFVRGIVLQALGYNSSMNWLLGYNLTPEAWAALGALAYAGRVDRNYWLLVSRDRIALCVALLAADADALNTLLKSNATILRMLPPYSHPYTAALWASVSSVCTRGLTRLYIYKLITSGILPPYEQLAACKGRRGHVEVWNLLHEDNVCVNGRVYPDVMRKALESRAKRWQVYSARCECTSMGVATTGRVPEWVVLCSRDPLLATRVAQSELARIISVNWDAWGWRIATRRVTPEYFEALKAETGFNSSLDALLFCSSLRRGATHPTPLELNKTLAGLIARLASIRVHDGALLSDQIVVRVCAYLLLRALGESIDTSILYAPPPSPIDAWVAGYIWTLRPPRDDPLLRETLLAWRMAVEENATRLASILEDLAQSLAEGNYAAAIRESRKLLDALGVELNETLLSPGLLRLASRLASLEGGKGGIQVNLTAAALLYSRLTGLDVEEARRLVSGNIGDVLQGLMEAGLNRTLARSIIESLPVPRRVARSIERLVEEAGRNPLAYAQLAALVRRYSRIQMPAPPPPPPLRAPAVDVLTPLAVIGASVAAGYLGYRLASMYARLPREPLRRRMLILLRLLEARSGVRRVAWETLREYARRLPEPHRRLLLEVLSDYERVRYGGVNEPRMAEKLGRAIRRLLKPWSGGSSSQRSH